MKRLQAYQFELMPNGEQSRAMRQYAGCCRVVYNKALAWQNEQYQADNTFKFGYTKIANLLPLWKSELAWLKDAPSQTLQQSLKNLESSFRNFFAKRADFPKLKKKGVSDSFRFPQGFKVEQHNNRLFLPKLGWIRYRNSRKMQGVAKNITVSQKCGKWYASIQTEREVAQPEHAATSIVGVDVGIARFATLSNGQVFESVNSFKQKQTRLARYQRALSRKIKFSSHWKKQKGKITRLHSTIANIRKDYLHKTTSTISQNHAMIVIEDLQISNMSKSAKGTIETKGRNVKQKSGLNRSILDQGWFEFRRQLEYKQAWAGGQVLAVNPRNTSRTCPCCKHVAKENRQTQAKFECVECGYAENADLVGAINILAAGHAVLACGVTVQQDRTVKHEPSEGIHKSSREPVGIPAL
ncbi:transposase [Methylotenera sp.]|uniref:RNA-guided endonuclease InsQ/TnpB family protein n=1 Tax=Methylotenera sp. TaxID=2051956 RepID=UPI002733E3F0|nr:transposase [Methylotenera sp.]MDP3211482.1 transposase [Methylotenera sp.]